MHCVVINGTGVRGSTYRLKEIFLDELKPEQRTEFYLPAEAPDYCVGCKLCFLESETRCPHYEKVQPIWQAMLEADLIVFAYPVYVLRTPGHVKSLLDHLGVHWFAHRPDPAMFRKKAAILTQSAGAPNGAAQKDVVTSLQWLGVSKIRKIGFRIGFDWDEIPEGKRNKIEEKVRKFARGFQSEAVPKENLRTRFFFALFKKIHASQWKKTEPGKPPSVDTQYWLDRGWIAKSD